MKEKIKKLISENKIDEFDLVINELVENEEKYRLIVENSLLAIYIVQNFQIKFCNKKFVEIFGYDNVEELININISNTVAPESLDLVNKNNQIREDGFKKLTVYEFKGKKKDGSIIDIKTLGAKITFNGKPAIQGTLIDITKQKKIEKQLLENEKLARSIIDGSPIGISVRDKFGTLLLYNNSWLKIWGMTEERLKEYKKPKKILKLDQSDFYFEKHKEEIKRVYSEGGHYYLHETKIMNIKADNAEWITQSFYALKNEAGNVSKVVILTVDITDRKRTELKIIENKKILQKEHEQLLVTLESIADGVITTDINGNVELLNRNAIKLIGCKDINFVGKDINEIFNIFDIDSDLKINLSIQNIIKNNNNKTIKHYKLISKDNKEYIISESTAPIKNKENKIIGIVIAFQDITKNIKLEKEIQKIHHLKSLGILAGGIAHDFNNLLTGIFGNISFAKKFIDEDNNAYKYLQSSEESVNKAVSLSNKLLTFSKGGDPIKEIVDIEEMIKKIAESILRKSKVNLTFESRFNNFQIKVDKDQFNQVISNLIINATDAMPTGGELSIKIEIVNNNKLSNLKDGKIIKISFKDNGSGISLKELESIFIPYYTTKKYRNGLGLSICYSIINKHNGLIEVESELNKGSIFTLYLPAFNISKKINIIENKKSDSTNKKKILIMDDNEIIRQMTGLILKDLKHSVSFALNGKEAIAKYIEAKNQNDPYDILILDLKIPGSMGGKETIKELLKIDPEIKAIVSSGYSNDPVIANYSDYGFKSKLVKPYLMKDLLTEINKL